MYQKCQLESFIFSFSISGNSDVQKRSNTVLMCSCVSRSTGEAWSQPDSGTRPESEGKTNFCEFFFWNRAELWCWNTRFFHFLETRNPTSNTQTLPKRTRNPRAWQLNQTGTWILTADCITHRSLESLSMWTSR